MTDITEFQQLISDLAQRKGWSKDQVWLMYSLFKECGELCDAIEHGLPQEEIGNEYADVMHFLCQLMKEKAPTINLDVALHKKIEDNEYNQKKTYDKGNFVRK